MEDQPVPEDFRADVEARGAALPEADEAHIAAKDALLKLQAVDLQGVMEEV